jgi:sarcosine oxidase subunit gamma
MSVMMPDVFKKRSLAYRQLADAEYTERSEGAIAYRMKGDSSAQVARASLLDLSVVSRTGFRGINAEKYLQQAGLTVPAQPNQAYMGSEGELILRLSQKEFWVLDGLTTQDDILDKLSQHALPSYACYSLFCQDSHAWFMLTGHHLADIMAKVCGVDLRDDAFPIGSIAQTSVARVNAIVVSHQVNSTPVFSLLSDAASAEYLWEALLDAMQEFDGAVVGLSTLIDTVD